MELHTGWLASPDVIGGIDHLGTQTPCQLVYAQLIPGITNVTDRARYYSLYPWLIRSFDQRHPSADAGQFVNLFRRGDFLLTLIAERHARTLNEPDFLHGAAMAGRTQLATAMASTENADAIDLDTFATQSKVATRYFQAALGGLGQYYMGTLAELGLLDTTSRDWVKYTHELGAPLADAVDAVTLADHFWDVVVSGKVDADDLDALHGFCPCGLRQGSHEHDFLEGLFFADADAFARAGRQRRLSLAMWLYLADAISGDEEASFDVATFRGAVYSAHLPDGQPWRLPDSLQATRASWGVYQANELLSVAFQSLFSSTLDRLAERQSGPELPFPTVEALATDLVRGTYGDALEKACGTAFYAEYLAGLSASAPSLGNWGIDPEHEHGLCEQLLLPRRNDLSAADRLITAFQLVGLLVVRADESRSAYDGLAITADELQRYPINLNSLRGRAEGWKKRRVRDVLQDMAQWCLTTHLSVALRKLRQTGRSTFRYRPGERGLEISEGTPVPTRTTPRFNQTTQILIDLGALRPRPGNRRDDVAVTELGRAWMARHAE